MICDFFFLNLVADFHLKNFIYFYVLGKKKTICLLVNGKDINLKNNNKFASLFLAKNKTKNHLVKYCNFKILFICQFLKRKTALFFAKHYA